MLPYDTAFSDKLLVKCRKVTLLSLNHNTENIIIIIIIITIIILLYYYNYICNFGDKLNIISRMFLVKKNITESDVQYYSLAMSNHLSCVHMDT